MWLLKTPEGADPAYTFRILPGNIKTIGRSAGAEFMVDAALVSRLHCRLTAGDGGVDVVDLDSTNGTYINDQRVKNGCIKSGDRLRVGRVEFSIQRQM